jgi:hypothetical protein
MVTHRIAEIVKARSDLSDEEIRSMSERDAWHRIRADTATAGQRDEETGHSDPEDQTE